MQVRGSLESLVAGLQAAGKTACKPIKTGRECANSPHAEPGMDPNPQACLVFFFVLPVSPGQDSAQDPATPPGAQQQTGGPPGNTASTVKPRKQRQ